MGENVVVSGAPQDYFFDHRIDHKKPILGGKFWVLTLAESAYPHLGYTPILATILF
jgi:hypothetical protein